MKNMIRLPYDTKKSKVWIDAYKGEGAYYTMKNLVLFHNCNFFDDNGNPLCVNSIGKKNYLARKLNVILENYN